MQIKEEQGDGEMTNDSDGAKSSRRVGVVLLECPAELKVELRTMVEEELIESVHPSDHPGWAAGQDGQPRCLRKVRELEGGSLWQRSPWQNDCYLSSEISQLQGAQCHRDCLHSHDSQIDY
jgi:hypothetical protein